MLNTIVAESIDDLADGLEKKIEAGTELAQAVQEVVAATYNANKQVCFMGDNYDEAWHEEAEKRGLKNLRTTPDALPEVLADSTVTAFEKYSVLSKRELESRYEVWIEQYVIRANIEAETADSIARTMLLPAALRYLELINEAEISELSSQTRELVDGLISGPRRARGGQLLPRRRRGPGARDLRARQPARRDGGGPRGGGQAREGGRRRPLAAAEVLGDAFHSLMERMGEPR